MTHVARNSNTKKKISEIPSIFVRNNKFKRWADSVNKIDPISIFLTFDSTIKCYENVTEYFRTVNLVRQVKNT